MTRSRNVLWLWLLSLSLLSAVLGDEPAQAFALLEHGDRATSTVADSIQTAARWSNESGTLAEGVRGLGGGLEFAIAPDFCDRLIPQFRDTYPPSCEQIKDAIQAALDQWTVQHPALAFTDVGASVKAALPPKNALEPWQGFGAELDFFVLSGKEYPPVANVGGYTSFWSVEQEPTLTNGNKTGGSTITSADIILNADTCFFFNVQQPVLECNHFQSLILHEVGHALGLDHPDELIARNIDTDEVPTNAVAISCKRPDLGLRHSKAYDANAAMNGYAGRPAPILSLTADDRGGLHFLYPPCAIATQQIPMWIWGMSLATGSVLVVGSLLLFLWPRSQKIKLR
ncbi:MAG: hypothetical protein WA902_18575 [Thermosynechococcaceae cyanobacterium]